MQTSSTCAPARTWARPTSAAASQSPSATRRRNFRLPRTFVRSPTSNGRLSAVSSTASRPETKLRLCTGIDRGPWLAASSARTRTCSGVVPQQPPTRFSHPRSRKRPNTSRKTSGPSWYSPSSSGSPAFGTHAVAVLARVESVRTCSVIRSGPVAQFRPRYKGSVCSRETAKASASWPPSIVPVGSIVTDTATGRSQPASEKA